jgi:hypothetical protein
VKVDVRITGIPVVKKLLGSIAAGAVRAQGPIISLSSSAPYAYGIETGRHRGGRLARRAGGAFMFRDGINAMRPRVGPVLGSAILKGPGAVISAKRQLQQQAIEEVRKRAPVRSGRLRASVRESGRLS